ncbi:MAG: zinc ribbon domain-containing protein [Myxococcales bacterium]|nr:zinc ribbon domain-containing protein [Myxococcales bacterium]
MPPTVTRCSNCGADVPSSAEQCRFCGAHLAGAGPQERSAPALKWRWSLGLVVLVAFAVSVTIVVVNRGGGARPGVRYTSVKATPSPSPMGYELHVSIQLTTTGAMPHMAPEVVVGAVCGAQSDHAKAFFMTLSNAPSGASFADTARLFFLPELPELPEECELTLTLAQTGGVERYCFAKGKTTAGACSP